MTGKVVLVIGGSSGIGRATAHKFAEAGSPLICGSDVDKLEEACKQTRAINYSFVVQLVVDYGSVDFLINNVARSIRRAMESSYNHFSDFERTMQLDYFAACWSPWACCPT